MSDDQVLPPPSAPLAPPPEPPVTTPADEPVSARQVFWWAVGGTLGVVLVVGTLYAGYVVRDLLVQIVVAAFIAMTLDPAVRWLSRRGVRRTYGVTLILFAFALLLGGLAWLTVPPLVNQATALATDFPGYLDDLRQRSPTLRELEDTFNLKPSVDAFGRTFVDRIKDEALAFGQRFLGALIQALLVIVLTIYFLGDLPRLRRSIVRLFPPRHRQKAGEAANVVIDKVGGYMIGNLLISAIAGVTTFVVLSLLDVPFALPLAFFVALTDLIPLIGATLGAIVCVIAAVATTDFWPNAVLVAVFFVVYQQVENYWIAPVVVRNTVDISAVAVLLAALVGASVLGLVGALIAIPVAAAIKVIVTPMMRARDDADRAELAKQAD